MENQTFTRNTLISALTKSPHGALKEYVPIVTAAVKSDPAFLAHLISWNYDKGQIRDAKVALPIASLAVSGFEGELAENSLAHFALLGPRELLRAYRFALEIRLPRYMQSLRRIVKQYLHEREQDHRGWDRLAVQHRSTLKELYALAHAKPTREHCNIVLFGRTLDKTKAALPQGSVFAAIANLKNQSPAEAAAQIVHFKIPFLIAMGALGEKAKDPDLALALIDRMTPTELVTNTKMLERLGLKTNPALRGAYEKALERTAKSTKNVLKTTRAVEAIEDETLKEKLRGVQQKQLKSIGPEGNWLVLADKSGSMQQAISISRYVASTLAGLVKGKVWLVFFDTAPLYIDVTGLTLDQIKGATRHISAGGGTSIGCGLNRMLLEKAEIDGIAIVSDGDENNAPLFPDVYKKYVAFAGKDVPVYLFHCDGGSNNLTSRMNQNGIEMQTFDLRHGEVDYYSLPNLVQTMRSNPYSLVEEIMDAPLLTLADVFKSKQETLIAV